MKDLINSELGKESQYPDDYNPDLLFPVPRQVGREVLELTGDLPFYGCDVWRAFELSWLDEHGKPTAQMAEFRFAHDTKHIIESKSFKLYLNSFNQCRFHDHETVLRIMKDDLSRVAEGAVSIRFFNLNFTQHHGLDIGSFEGVCLDKLAVVIHDYVPNSALLLSHEEHAQETVFSHLLKSNCPVTGQPDWATVKIDYKGPKIEHAGLLKYIISFREHQGFHEQCVEHIFRDLNKMCRPEQLTVTAFYTRRGGLDINPMRTNCATIPEKFPRFVRQ